MKKKITMYVTTKTGHVMQKDINTKWIKSMAQVDRISDIDEDSWSIDAFAMARLENRLEELAEDFVKEYGYAKVEIFNDYTHQHVIKEASQFEEELEIEEEEIEEEEELNPAVYDWDYEPTAEELEGEPIECEEF